jgi:plastocyanin
MSSMPHSATDDPAGNPVADRFPQVAQLLEGDEPWDSGILQRGEAFSYTFTVPGSYRCLSIPHVLWGMVGAVEVAGRTEAATARRRRVAEASCPRSALWSGSC